MDFRWKDINSDKYPRNLLNKLFLPSINSFAKPVSFNAITSTFESIVISYPIHKQIGGTCYAYSTATIVRAALMRIDNWKVPTHDELCQKIIRKYGVNGGHSHLVLNYLKKQ